MLVSPSLLFLTAIALLLTAGSCATVPKSVTIQNNDPLIYFHGRWDSSPGTWWWGKFLNITIVRVYLTFSRAGSGLKLNVRNLKSLSLDLGPHTTTPFTSVGVSFDYGEFITANISEGSNAIPVPASLQTSSPKEATVVRINVEGWQNNRMNLESITLNEVRQSII
jgi:hypothetical protein